MLDASALLALIGLEAGAERVAAVLGESRISAVNLCEVAGKLADAGLGERDVESHLGGLGMTVVAFDRAAALAAAALRRAVPRSLSLGDRACLALGIQTGGDVITADRDWERLNLPGVTVTAIC